MRWSPAILLLLLLLLLLLCAPAAQAATGPCVIGTERPLCHVVTGKVTFVADGDTVDVDIAGDGRGPRRTRVTGIQAMEMTRYSKYASRRRGACHAVAATDRVDRLVRLARRRARLASYTADARSGTRIRRSLALRIGGRWRDVGAILLREGHALWLPNPNEWPWNASYGQLAEQASRAGRNLWDRDACRRGPSQGSALALDVNWDAAGNDGANVNGEWLEISNRSGRDVALGGWWVRDSHLRRYTFPAGAVVQAGRSVRVHVGSGSADGRRFYWGLRAPAFENVGSAPGIGDGGYLFDRHGDLRAWQIYR